MKNKILASMQEKVSEFIKDPKKKKCDWRHKWWDCWKEFKFKHPWRACSLQYFSLFLFVFLVGHILSGILSDIANVDYFRYPLSETFRHPFNLTANLTINKSAEMHTIETYAAEMYADNARSILCTLVASEAAIVAIVVSLTLIAIELTASAYSPRVMDISIRNPDMWLLLLIYGVSIFYAIVLIKQLPYDSGILYDDVSLAFWFGVVSYAALVPYLLNTIRLLKPTNIVKRVSANIAEDKILKYIPKNHKKDKEGTSKPQSIEDTTNEISRTNGDTGGHEKKDNENPIQPILDIIYRSINNYDLETVREGLEEIVTHAEKVINLCFFSWDDIPEKDNEKLLRFLRDDLDIDWATKKVKVSKTDGTKTICIDKNEKSAKIEVDEKKEKATLKISDLKETPDLNVKKKDDKLNIYLISKEEEQKISEYFCDPLKRISRLAASKDDAGSTIEVIKNLETFGVYTAEAKLNAATDQVAAYLGAVGKISAGKGKAFEEAVTQVAESLGAVGKNAAGKGEDFEDAVSEVAKSLGAVGEAAADRGLEDATLQTVTCLKTVSDDAAKNHINKAITQAAMFLGAVGKRATGKGQELEDATNQAVLALEHIGAPVQKKEKYPEDATNNAVWALRDIGITAAGKGKQLEEVVKSVALSLSAVGKAAVGNWTELETVISEVASSLTSVGEAAVVKGKELEEATKQVVDAIKDIGVVAVGRGKELEERTKRLVKAIGDVGVAAAGRGKELEEVADRAKKALVNLKGDTVGKKNLENVKNAIASAIHDMKKDAAEK